MMIELETVIIRAGVVGLACARKLAINDFNVLGVLHPKEFFMDKASICTKDTLADD